MRVDGSGCDFEVHLNIDICRTGMLPLAVRAEQFGRQATEHDEFGSLSVVMDDGYESSLGRSARRT